MAGETRAAKTGPGEPGLPEGLYEALLQAAPDAIVVVDDTGRIRFVNRQVESLFGYAPAEILGRSVDLLVPQRIKGLHPSHRASYAADPRTRPMGAGLDLAARRKDGTEFPVDISLSSIATEHGVLVSAAVRDVSERKLYESLLQAAPDAIVVVDATGRIRLVNQQVKTLFGYEQEELLGKSVDMLVPVSVKDAHPGHRAKYLADRRTRPMGAGLELSARRKDGSEFPVDISLSSIHTKEGVLVSAAVRDVSDRKISEERNRLAAIVDASSDAIVGETLDGTITSWNPAAERVYGYRAEDAIGRNISMIYPPDRADELTATLETLARGERIENLETFRVRSDGARLDALVSTSPIRDRQGRVVGAAAIARDLTERAAAAKQRERLEADLQQSQRLESVGQLAGGVAHDFNNLIAVIMNYAAFVADELGDQPQLKADVEEIQRAAERAAVLTRQLLIFSRREVPHPEKLDINSVVSGLRNLLERTIGEHIELVTRTPKDLWPVNADRGQIEQVIINLAVNARDAMPQGGRLVIETSRSVLDEDYVASRVDLKPGRYVRLTVADSGVGMTREVAERAFDPFFTTKPKGKGTGLGLATVYGIVKQAGGNVSLYSEPGRGTSVNIELPADLTAAELPVLAPATLGLEGHGESVLLVEDESAVRQAARRILERNGYAVLEAATPAAAIAICADPARVIDLVLTDVVMPEMTGIELAKQLRAARPGLLVTYMSGYPQEVIAQQGVATSEIQITEKPFTRESLLRAVAAGLKSSNPT